MPVAVAAACLLLAGASVAEETTAKAYRRPIIEAPICEEPPLIDGVLDDPCWRQVYHTDEFWNNFKFLLGEAKKINIYKPIDYKNKPVRYCGMTISDNPYFDV